MELEVDVAVTWWTAHLERSVATPHSEALSRGASATTAGISAFRDAFRRALMAYLQAGSSWRPREPTWGQGTRAFGVEVRPGRLCARQSAIMGIALRGTMAHRAMRVPLKEG